MGWFQDILLFLQSTSPTEIKYSLPTRDIFSFLENPVSAENTDNQTMVFRESSCSGTFINMTGQFASRKSQRLLQIHYDHICGMLYI